MSTTSTSPAVDSILSSLESQYRASLIMVRNAIEACPEELWTDESYPNPYWRIAYHVLFYTHLYLSPTESEIEMWEHAKPNAHFMGRLPWPPHDESIVEGFNTKEELMEYADWLLEHVPELLAAVPLSSPESGFWWIPFSRFELNIYNIRHVQHHAGQLSERLRTSGVPGLEWRGMGADYPAEAN